MNNNSCNAYPIFEANQVLMAEQLNQAVSYLESRDRLTRNKLIGIGIVCGLDVTSTPDSVTITEGCGITSEGHLVYIEESNLTRYRPYTDPVEYPPFWLGEDLQVPLWELLPDIVEEEDEFIQPLNSITLTDKAVLLYLEAREIDLETCTGDDCDEKGIRYQMCVKKLLIEKSALNEIIQDTYGLDSTVNLDAEFNARFLLPDVKIPRPVSLSAFDQNTHTGEVTSKYRTVIEDSIPEVEEALIASYEDFDQLFLHEFSGNPFQSGDLTALYNSAAINRGLGIQYFYDFLKDLVLAYEEYRDTVFDYMSECCPDENLFPRHLMLGSATLPPDCKPSVYRQQFIASPIHNDQARRREQVLSLFKRMVQMVNHFRIPNPEQASVKITPSKEKEYELSRRSIPYYYDFPASSLHQFWNHDISRQCQSDQVLSYHAETYKKASTPAYVTDPLEYDHEMYPFLRVEGHIGKNVDGASSQIKSVIKANNLPVDLVALKIKNPPVVQGTGDLNVLDRISTLRKQLEKAYSQLSVSGGSSEYLNFQKSGGQNFALSEPSIAGTNRGEIQSTPQIPELDPEILEGLRTALASGEIEEKDRCRFRDLESLYRTYRSELICAMEREITFFANIQYGSESGTYEEGPVGVRGTVRSEGEPIPGVNVIIKDTAKGTTTGADGNFPVISLTPGNYTLQVSIVGFQSKSVPVKIVEDRTLVLDVDMQQASTSAEISGTYMSGGTLNLEEDAYTYKSTGEETQPKEAGEQLHLKMMKGYGGEFYKEVTGDQPETVYSVGSLYTNIAESGQPQNFYGIIYDNLLQGGLFDAVQIPGIIFQIYYPILIMADIEALVATLTESLHEFDEEEFDAEYQDLIDTARNYREQIRSNLADPENEPQGNEDEILKHLGNLIESCDVDKLKALLEEYKRRLADLEKMQWFGNYIQRHPGMEHMAGVPKGGTFFLMYNEDKTVVGDFALPYLCCSECPPAICEDTATIFKLPMEEFCTDEEEEYKFIISPPGGQVTGPGVRREETTGDYYFQPSHENVQVGINQFEYSLNGKTYQLAINVFEITAEFSFNVIGIDPDANQAEVQFTGNPPDADSFEWNFDDGTDPSTEQNPLHTFDISSQETFNVEFTVTKGACDDTTTQTLSLFDCDATFTYQVTSHEGTSATVEFIPQMTDADSYQWNFGDGQSSNEANPSHQFDLSEAQTYSVTLEVTKGACETEHSETITLETCSANFTIDETGRTSSTITYVFPAEDSEADSYDWATSDGQTGNQQSISFSFTRGDATQSVEVKLTVQKGTCTDTVTRTVNIPPALSGELSLPSDYYCTGPLKEYPVFTYNPSDATVDGPGVTVINDQYVFDPNEAGVGEHKIELLVDGEVLATFSVVVLQRPQPAFEWELIERAAETVIIEFFNRTEDQGYTYRWQYQYEGITPRDFSEEADPGRVELSVSPNINVIQVYLFATNTQEIGECTDRIIQEIGITIIE